MLCKLAIENASLILGIVMIDNIQISLQIVHLKGQVFTSQRMLLDFRAHPLILDKALV